MMPPGFGPERGRSGNGGGHGLPSLRHPYGDALHFENMVPAMHNEFYSRQGPIGNGNGLPGMVVGGAMGMPPPIKPTPAEVWDIKTLASQRHRALVAHSHDKRMGLETQMQQPVPPHACPPGFMPLALHAEPPLSNAGPPGFRPPPVFNEALPPQSLPPGFRPPNLFRDSTAIMQPELRFHNAEPNPHRPELCLDNRPEDTIGRHDTMYGSANFGAAKRHGWYINRSSSCAGRVDENRFEAGRVDENRFEAGRVDENRFEAGRVDENRFEDPQIPRSYISPSGRQPEHFQNSIVAKLENENWRRETLPQHVRLHSPPIPVSVSQLPDSYQTTGWAGNLRDGNLASTHDAGKRRRNPEGIERMLPFKRQCIDHEADSSRRDKSRRALEWERTWPDGYRASNHERDDSHPASFQPRKQMESRSTTEYSGRPEEHWRDRQEWRTRHPSPHSPSHRGPYPPRDRNHGNVNLETFQESEVRIRPGSFRPTHDNDRPSLLSPARPDRLSGKQKQPRNDRYFNNRSRRSFSPRRSPNSWYPYGRLNIDRKSVRLVDRTFRKGSRSPRLPAKKSSSTVETNEQAVPRKDAKMHCIVERKATPNGNSASRHSSRDAQDSLNLERSRNGPHFLGFRANQQRDPRGNVVPKETRPNLPAQASTVKVERASPPPMRASTNQMLLEKEINTERRGNSGEKLLPHKKSQSLDGKARSSASKHVANIGKNCSAITRPVSASSLNGTRKLTKSKSACATANQVPQASGVDRIMSSEKVLLRKRRHAAGYEGPALPSKRVHQEQKLDVAVVSSPKLGHGEMLHSGSGTGTGVTERTGQKVIFTGHRSEVVSRLKVQKSASGSDLQSPESLGKSQIVGAGLLQDVPGRPCSQLVKVTLPSLTVKKEKCQEIQPNDSNTEGMHVRVHNELQHLSTSEENRQVEQQDGSTSNQVKLAEVMADKGQANLVQGEPDMKVLPRPSDTLIPSASGGNLVTQPRNKAKERTDVETNCASNLTNPRAINVSEGAEVTGLVPELVNSNIGENRQAVESGQYLKEGSESTSKLVRVLKTKGNTILTEEREGLDVIKQPSEEAGETMSNIDRELGTRQKALPLGKGGSLRQIASEKDATVDDKNNVLESSNTGKDNKESNLVTSQMLSFKGGVPIAKSIGTFPTSSHLLDLPKAIPQLGAVGRSFKSNKTWIREVKAMSTRLGSNTPLPRPVGADQPSAYVRKKFSIIRYSTSLLSNQPGAQPEALSKLPREVANKAGNLISSCSASNLPSYHEVNTLNGKTAAAASTSMKTLDTKMVDTGAKPPEILRSSTVGVHIEEETAAARSESIVTGMPVASKSSPLKPCRFEASSSLTTLAFSPPKQSPGRGTDDAVGYAVDGTRLYMQEKSNQGLVGSPSTSTSPVLRRNLEKSDVPLGYIKRKTNQLVRCSHQREVNANGALQNVVGEVGSLVKYMSMQRRSSTQLKMKTKLGRVLSQKKGKTLGLARVWKLSDEGKFTTTGLGASRDWRYPLFPWKKMDIVTPRLRRGRPPHEGKMGALFFHIRDRFESTSEHLLPKGGSTIYYVLMAKGLEDLLQRYRSGHPLYTRSADGFSLHRSGVMSGTGANLKWTKSLNKQSILASEAATKVVAEAEKKKREKKKAAVMAVARARDVRRAAQAQIRSGTVDAYLVSSSKPLGIGVSSYVRKGFGNQLVRDSRTIARAFASEKVRWSLHNARLRRAKKSALCVYYTRFGVCKRGDGKCLYIHDPEKVAVCTKFLRGSCSDAVCRLTHKVIPERMPDCSYFLEGLCTNESCPYRHVNVNPKAPICEGFLQGYCADGDTCNKKHTYVCPEYTLTGKCSSSTCKRRHIVKTKQPSPASNESVGSKREGRYFAPTASTDREYQGQSNGVAHKIGESVDDRAESISVDELDLESSKENQDGDMLLDHKGVVSLRGIPKGNVLESLLKPRFLLKREVSS